MLSEYADRFPDELPVGSEHNGGYTIPWVPGAKPRPVFRSPYRLSPKELEEAKQQIVGANGVRVDPKKTAVATPWAVPSNVSELRLFLGLTNYFRRFI